jgi:hypothetical protein
VGWAKGREEFISIMRLSSLGFSQTALQGMTSHKTDCHPAQLSVWKPSARNQRLLP